MFVLYYIVINVLGFIYMWRDKQKAMKRNWRIKERTLWTIALLGGAIFMMVAMFYFRHKTKHLSFRIGLPILSIGHSVVMLFYFLKKLI